MKQLGDIFSFSIFFLFNSCSELCYAPRTTFDHLSKQPCLVAFWKLKKELSKIEIKHTLGYCIVHITSK